MILSEPKNEWISKEIKIINENKEKEKETGRNVGKEMKIVQKPLVYGVKLNRTRKPNTQPKTAVKTKRKGKKKRLTAVSIGPDPRSGSTTCEGGEVSTPPHSQRT
jgi:hypothetical protein